MVLRKTRDFLIALLMAAVIQAVVFGFPHWGMNALGVVLTPLFQLLLSTVLFFGFYKLRSKKGNYFSINWLYLIWGVSIAIDVFLVWYVVQRDL